MRQKIVAKLSCLLDLLEIDIVDGEFDSLFFIQTFGDTARYNSSSITVFRFVFIYSQWPAIHRVSI